MAATDDEGQQDAEPENEQEGGGLSLEDVPEESSTDEVDPCHKRCGRDHAVVLEECRFAFPTPKGGVGASPLLVRVFLLSTPFLVWQEKVCGASEIGARTPSAETQVTHVRSYLCTNC